MEALAGYGSSGEGSGGEGGEGGGREREAPRAGVEGLKRKKESSACSSSGSSGDAHSPPPPPKLARGEDERHQGRVRSFPHVDGNYAGFVYVEVGGDGRPDVLAAAVAAAAWADGALPGREVVRTPPAELHVTLSRTFAVRLKQIAPLVRALRKRVGRERAFAAALGGAALYSNDEDTRTFAGLQLTTGREAALRLVAAVDAALAELGLAPYYTDPSFHVSVAWALGPLPQPALELPADAAPPAALWLECVRAKIGERVYDIPLRGGA